MRERELMVDTSSKVRCYH